MFDRVVYLSPHRYVILLLMSKSHIIAVPDERLRQPARRVQVFTSEIETVIEDMQQAALAWEKHRAHEVGVALAAPQIGVLERIIITRRDLNNKDNHDFEVFINPQIRKYEGEITQEPEGCLSVPDVYGLVPRYETVRLDALDQSGAPVRLKAKGFLARVLQHEVDHLHGKLFVDKVTDDAFYQITEEGQLSPLSTEKIDAARVLWHR